MTEARHHDNDFLSALARFESCLETPIVPGELPNWLVATRKSCQAVGPLLRDEVENAHQEQLRQIVKEDMELAPRVTALKATDQELLARHDDLLGRLTKLCDIGQRLEPHEAKLDEQIAQVTRQGLDFVIEARKQDNAMTTWHQEAFNRDRGVAD